MRIEKTVFGTTKQGNSVSLYTISNQHGTKIAVTDLGATLVKVIVKDKNGTPKDVVLGYDTPQKYEEASKFFGAIVGRCANRIGGASFELNGKTYTLAQNNNGNNLHSGMDFFNVRIWDVIKEDNNQLTFALESRDGDQGYPGTVKIEVTYTLTEDDTVKIEYYAVPDQDTILNMTNHSYFNLDGHEKKDVLAQRVWIDADTFTRADAESIPTGEIVPVEGTPMDFRSGKMIGEEIESDYEAIRLGNGYDHNWVLNHPGTYRKVAEMEGAESGIGMEVWTDLPGMQFYTANFVEHEEGKEGICYGKRSGACFEPQYFPDAIHKEHFEGPVCKAGSTYHTTTAYHFTVK